MDSLSATQIYSKFILNQLWFSRIHFELIIFFANSLFESEFIMNKLSIARIHKRYIIVFANLELIHFFGNSILIHYLFSEFILLWLFFQFTINLVSLLQILDHFLFLELTKLNLINLQQLWIYFFFANPLWITYFINDFTINTLKFRWIHYYYPKIQYPFSEFILAQIYLLCSYYVLFLIIANPL